LPPVPCSRLRVILVKRNNPLTVLLGLLALALCLVTPGCNSSNAKPPLFSQAPMLRSEFVFTRAPFRQCHASTLVELARGKLLAAWFGGAHEGAADVAIWGSIFEDGKWSPPKVWASAAGTACWNPVLFLLQPGEAALYFKYGVNPRSWKGAVATSSNGVNWSTPVDLPSGILGPIKNKPIRCANGDIVAGSSTETRLHWNCWVNISSDNGATWSLVGPLHIGLLHLGIIQPTLWESSPGHLVMLTRASGDLGRICRAVSSDGGHTWSDPVPTSLPNPNSGIDAVRMSDGVIALVYNHTTQSRSPLNIAFSRDNGLTWSDPLTLESEPGEFSYPAVIQTSDGMLNITYTWQRRRIRHVVIDPRIAVRQSVWPQSGESNASAAITSRPKE
jgi:predicted neuraminidase